MKQQQRVVLYGSSLILDTVAVSLRRYPGLEVLPLDSPLPGGQQLAALAPDVVLFDLRSARPDLPGPMLEARPHLLLIGLDADSDRVVIWAGESSRVLSVGDLMRVMKEKGGRGAGVTRRHLAKYARCSSDGDAETVSCSGDFSRARYHIPNHGKEKGNEDQV